MENFFTRPVVDRNGVTHVVLLQCSWEELLQTCVWEDLYIFLEQVDVAWFSRDAYVYRYRFVSIGKSPLVHVNDQEVHHTHHIRLNVNTSDNHYGFFGLTVCLASVTSDEPTQVYTQLFQLLVQTPDDSIVWFAPGYQEEADEEDDEGEPLAVADFPISVETFSCLGDIVAVRNNLEFAFDGFFFSQEHCRTLASFHTKIRFAGGSFTNDGRSLFEAMGNNRGPMKLSISYSTVDALALHNALCTTVSLRSLALSSVFGMFPLVIHSLAQYTSLIDFSFNNDRDEDISERDLIDLFENLSKHPKLEKFSFYIYVSERHAFDDEKRARYSDVILNLLRKNKVLLELRLGGRVSRLLDTEFILKGIKPYLQANLYRRRVKELVDESEQDFQRRLFSRALVCPQVNQNPTFMYMLLSGLHDRLSELYDEKKECVEPGRATKRPRLP